MTVTTAQPWPPRSTRTSGRAPASGSWPRSNSTKAPTAQRDLIGTGPFKLKEWVVNDHFTAVKNPDYWQKDKDGVQLPYLDQITFKRCPMASSA